MLDVKFIENNIDLVKKSVHLKKAKADVDKIVETYEKLKKTKFNFDNLRAEQNRVSKEIGQLKRNGKDAKDKIKEMQDVAKKTKELSAEISNIDSELNTMLLEIPNIPHESVPVGNDEEDNEIIRQWNSKKEFDFSPISHLELAEKNNLLDLDRSAKLTGSGFVAFTGKGAKLERALINFMLDYHVENHAYMEMTVPYIVNRETMTGTGQLPKLEEDMYHIDKDDLFLIPTAEVPVTNFYAKEIISYKDLPKKMTAITPCFRREAGSYGKETKGLKRVHQFNKVELVRLVKPENSFEALENLTNEAEKILQELGLHYRVAKLCTGDLSFASTMTYDLEVWAPGEKEYLEVSSISNFVDFQARRANLRYRDENRKVNFLHTLNGSGVALPRLVIAVIETYQNEDGTISVPEILKPYLNGKEIL